MRGQEHEMKANHPIVAIRLLEPEDSSQVLRLAQLDTAAPPPQPLLGGLIDGRLVAAHSLASGESIADPFLRTGEIRSLLAARARQVNGSGHR
jgi:hypothetical protein